MIRCIGRLTLIVTVWLALTLAPYAGYATGASSPADRANPPTATSTAPRALAHATGPHGAGVPAGKRAAVAAYGRLPLNFEQNQGQVDRAVSYLAHGQGYTAYLTASGLVLALAPSTASASRASGRPHALQSRRLTAAARATVSVTAPVLRLQLLGTRGNTAPIAQHRLLGVANYYLGNNQAKWLRNI